MMKILSLPAYFYPEVVASSHLTQDLYEAMTELGMSIEIFVPEPTRGVSEKIRSEYKNREVEEYFEGKLKVNRFPMIREKTNPIQRAYRYFKCANIQKRKGKQAKDIDLIFVSSTPPIQGAMAAKVKKKLKVPFVYCLQDIFPDSLVGTGLSKKGSLFWRIGRKIEDYTYRNADKIIVISEDFKRNIIAKGVPEDKIEVIYNWVDEKAVIPISKEKNSLFEEYHLDRNNFHVVYAGNLGNAQNLNIIIDVAKTLKTFHDLKFVIFGTGGQEEELNQIIKEGSIDNVYMFPLQPIERISEVYSLGDASVVSCKPGLGESAFPSKTWSIMSAGTAVLANFDNGTELQEVIENNKVGLFTESGNIDQFRNAILYLYNNREICSKFGQKGRDFILKNLTKEVGTSKYIEIFKQLINKE